MFVAAIKDGPMDGHMASESGPMDGPMASESGHMALESGPMDGPMDVSYRLTGTYSRINDFNKLDQDTNRATGSDGPMKIPLVAGQRASPESAWPSESAPDPAGVWRSVLGRLKLEMPRDYFNTFLQPCVGYAWEDGDLVVAAESAFVVSWLDLPLHRAMAQEALADTLGQEDPQIIWRVLPSVVEANEERDSTVREPPGEPSPVEPEYCPEHAEPHLRVRSRWYTAGEVEKENDDEIYYCKGGGSLCTWVYSVLEAIGHRSEAGIQLEQSTDRRLDLRRANIQNLILTNANLKGANLAGAKISHPRLFGVDFSNSDFRYANLQSAVFPCSRFKNAVFDHADLSYSAFNIGGRLPAQELLPEQLVDALALPDHRPGPQRRY